VTVAWGTPAEASVSASASAPASAVSEAASGNGLAVSPPTFEVVAAPGETVRRTVKLQNLSDSPRRVDVAGRNFTAKGEEGQADLTSEPTTFALADWLSVAPNHVELPPKSEQSFDFALTLPAGAEPGG